MARRRLIWFAAALCLFGTACASDEPKPANLPETRTVLEVSSPAFGDGDAVPPVYTCDGDNISPPIRWTQAKDTAEYLLVMNDPDAPGGGFLHWLLMQIDPQRSSVGEDEVPSEALEGTNSAGDIGYTGPCPPEGDSPHNYEITVFALNRHIELAPDVGYADLLDQIDCCVGASGTLEASYGR